MKTLHKTWLLRAGMALLALALVVGFIRMVRGFLSGAGKERPHAQQIALLRQPPPPPPKPEEKPPEQPKIKEEIKIAQPDAPKPDDKPADARPAPDQPLGVDAAGGAGSDGFGLAGRIGGRDLLSAGGGGGAYYTGLVQKQFYEALMRNKKVQKEEFRIVVKVWLGDDGRVQRSDVVVSSGNKDTDQLIQATLADMAPLKEVPPLAMRQIQMRLANRS